MNDQHSTCPADEVYFLPAWRLAELIRAGRLAPTAVIESLLRRISEADASLINAFCWVDGEGARAAARRVEEEVGRRSGLDRFLLGVPVAVKDELAVAGMPSAKGSRLCVGNPPDLNDAAVVRRLRAAGAIIIGKTHMPEFGHKGVTDNLLGPGGAVVTTATPCDPARTAGGSSGGAAASVAAGFCPLAIGTDIAGSVRIPASCCGVVGLKPTFGMIPRTPAGNTFSLVAVGPIARTAADIALAMRVIAGPDGRDRFSLPSLPPNAWDLAPGVPAGLRVGWAPSLTGGPVHPGVENTCRQGLAALECCGAKVSKKPPLLSRGPASQLMDQLRILFQVGCLGWLKEAAGLPDRGTFDAKAHLLSPTFRTFVEPAWAVSLSQYLEAEAAVTLFVEGVAADYFADCDILATPTIAVPPLRTTDVARQFGPDQVNGEPVDRLMGWILTWPFNLTGEPAVSAPCGTVDDPNPVPVGLQLVGRRGEDGLLLRVVSALECELARRGPNGNRHK
jgi:Asp-tRNA(Asn)/Glu-tRNA(Gln) amidotransferase A subunit family amidase